MRRVCSDMAGRCRRWGSRCRTRSSIRPGRCWRSSPSGTVGPARKSYSRRPASSMSRVSAPVRTAALLAVLVLGVGGCGAGTPTVANWAAPVSGGGVAPSGPASPGSAGPSPSGSVTPAPPPPSGPLDLKAVSGKTIVIDAGHNGGNGAHPEIINQPVPMGTGTKACDTTGTSTNAGYSEAAFTFDVANRLATLLRAAGAKVLVECGSMRNAGDAAFMTGATGRQKVAEGLAGGLAAFLATG